MGLRNTDRLVPLSGVVFFVLIVVGFVVAGETPDGDARPAEVVAFYDENYGEQIAAAALITLAGLFFVPFTAALRDRLAPAEGGARRTASVLQASGAMLGTGLAILGGVHIALTEAGDDRMAAAASALNQLDINIFTVVAVPLFLFLAALAVAALRFAVVPRWVGWAAVVLAVVMLTPVSWAAMALTTVLVAAVGIWLAIEASHAAAPTPPAVARPTRGAMA